MLEMELLALVEAGLGDGGGIMLAELIEIDCGLLEVRWTTAQLPSLLRRKTAS